MAKITPIDIIKGISSKIGRRQVERIFRWTRLCPRRQIFKSWRIAPKRATTTTPLKTDWTPITHCV